MEDDVRRSTEAGFVAHLTKPIDFRRLDEAIRRAAIALPDPDATPDPDVPPPALTAAD